VGWRNSEEFVDQVASDLQCGKGFSLNLANSADLD
jgi:hypothetical protein